MSSLESSDEGGERPCFADLPDDRDDRHDAVVVDLDVVGAIPVHLFAGIWGTIAVVFYNGDASLITQLTGIVAYGVFTFIAAAILWYILKATVGIRVSEEAEIMGLDTSELGMEAYPDFTRS